MIKINLADRKRSSSVTGSTAVARAGAGLDLGQLKGSLSDLKELPLRRMALPLIVAVVATYTLESYKTTELQKLEEESQKILSEKPKLQAEINKMKDYEAIKASTEKDEIAISTKLQAVRELIGGRGVAPRVLETLAKLTPQDIWLTEFNFKEGDIEDPTKPATAPPPPGSPAAAAAAAMPPKLPARGSEVGLKGLATSFGKLSPFLEAINSSEFFQPRRMTLKDSQTTKDAQGREVVSFELVPERHVR